MELRRTRRERQDASIPNAARRTDAGTLTDPLRALVQRLQLDAGNAAVAGALRQGGSNGAMVVSRLRDAATWRRDSELTTGPYTFDRSAELAAVDRAVEDHDEAVKNHASPDTRKQCLVAIEVAINAWRGSKGGTASASARKRGPQISALFDEVQTEKRRVDIEIKRGKIEVIDPTLLAGIPGDHAAAADLLFARFMAHFRGRVGYTLTTRGGGPWDGTAGPFACGTFARAFADMALAAGLEATATMVTPRNFVTPLVDGDFIDTDAQGNIQVGGRRVARYFFTEHWVTEVEGRYYCPTSGKALSGQGAPELVDATIGQLAPADGQQYAGAGVTVRKVGTTPEGGGLYDLSRV